MRARTLTVRLLTTLSIATLLASAAATPALAQGKKGGSPAPSAAAATAKKTPPGQAKKSVTTGEAVELTRNLLTKHGFTIVRVESVKGAQVIYYRAGNRGRGRGLGPVQSMTIRPSGSIVSFEAAPEKVRLDIKVQLGF